MLIEKKQRKFLPKEFNFTSWNELEVIYQKLLDLSIQTLDDFKTFLLYKSELDAFIEENAAWRYIKMTIDTQNKEFSDAYTFFITEIQPKLSPFEDLLNKKLLTFQSFIEELSNDKGYSIYFRLCKIAVDLFREENIPIEAEINQLTQQYGAINGAQSIHYQGKDWTLQQASLFLKDKKEELRKEVFELISERRKKDRVALDDLMNQLIEKRHVLALNAGFENFREYKFVAMGRFDYSVKDCLDFHLSIQKHIVPLSREIQQKQANKLGKKLLKPWDTEVDPINEHPLKPFTDGKELFEKTKLLFGEMDTFFEECVALLGDLNHIDLESKKGKAPGGYNYPLYESGVPFIFMNAVGSQRDLTTMVHESGHAIHSILSHSLHLTGFKNLPSEIAEVASMSMELMSMDYWHVFYTNEKDLNRAKKEQLESIISVLPWIACVDEFQHWIYLHPKQTNEDRKNAWTEIQLKFSTGSVDWTEYEDIKSFAWQKQLHIFEVPFYYIEYGFAQLAALSIWKNFKENKEKTLQQYKDCLSLGYTKSLPELYQIAGVFFDFSENYVKELSQFLWKELKKLD
ncbi:MAG: M3 family oligoendopeptidase [Flavobacteriia bacterium]|nr:M3 family oligoendopeptidase [Flavobacteriia bacterium]